MARPRLEDAQTRLLAAGLALFARQGCEGVNSNAIARAAGLGIGTFYFHFANKYALLRALQLRTLDGLRAARQAAVGSAGSSLEEQVRASVGAAVAFAADHPEAYRVCFGRERTAPAHAGPVVSESTRGIAAALATWQRAGVIDQGLDPELAARGYLSMETGMLLWWLEDPGRTTAAKLIEALVRAHPGQA
ncbi:TetR/AcrR family transcriptional regulator, partial [Myxococcota bacterium]|nr:TetR/AcrR family transcriptional regulator [Myxococcota bacterium]